MTRYWIITLQLFATVALGLFLIGVAFDGVAFYVYSLVWAVGNYKLAKWAL